MARPTRPEGGTRAAVATLLDEGYSQAKIARILGVSTPTVCYHVRKLGRVGAARFARRYDWTEIQRYYDAGHTLRECQVRFGFNRGSWHKAVQRGDIVPRPQTMPIEELLVAGRIATGRYHLKGRVIKAGLKDDRCEECGLREWRGRRLSLALHHVNGDRHDNRLENFAYSARIATARLRTSAPSTAGRRRPRRLEQPASGRFDLQVGGSYSSARPVPSSARRSGSSTARAAISRRACSRSSERPAVIAPLSTPSSPR
jgi:AcrR family transcriptional regulator